MNKGFRAMILVLLCFLLPFTPSCKEKAADPLPNNNTSAGRYIEVTQRVVYYTGTTGFDWRDDYAEPSNGISPPTISDDFTITKQIWIRADDPRFDSEEDHFEGEPIYKQYLYVSDAVVSYLEGDDGVERQFLIRPMGYEQIYTDNAERRDAFLQDWCDAILPEEGLGEVVSQIGFISWWGTDEDLEKLGKYELDFLVCFYEEFADIYGMSIEKAQELIAAGELDIWSCPVEDSPMYGRSAAEIAAYLAKQEREP